MAAAICRRKSCETRVGSRSARDTVIAPTPASLATSWIVGLPLPRRERGFIDALPGSSLSFRQLYTQIPRADESPALHTSLKQVPLWATSGNQPGAARAPDRLAQTQSRG